MKNAGVPATPLCTPQVVGADSRRVDGGKQVLLELIRIEARLLGVVEQRGALEVDLVSAGPRTLCSRRCTCGFRGLRRPGGFRGGALSLTIKAPKVRRGLRHGAIIC